MSEKKLRDWTDCKICGKVIGRYVTTDICNDCSEKKELENQKHEEIKQMAWEIYRECINRPVKESAELLKMCWEWAEQFYNFAKEKEEGAGEETTKD